MSPATRRSVLLLLLAAMAAAALLAAALPDLRLGPGLPLPAIEGGQVGLDAPPLHAAGPVTVRWAVLWLLGAGAVAALLHALWRARRGLRLAGAAAVALRGLALVLLLSGATVALLFLGPRGGERVAEPPVPPAVPAPRSPLGAPPTAVLWLTAAFLLGASALAAAWLARSRPRTRQALDLVGLEAERARAALLAGDDARGVIVACYARMSAALAEDRGIERPGPMTAREFVGLLGSLGVPGPPVRELTLLFEAVRYGPDRPGSADEARALACLGPIVDHCRSSRGATT